MGPPSGAGPGGATGGRAAALEILVLGGTLGMALALPPLVEHVMGRRHDWVEWLLPAGVLLAVSGLKFRRTCGHVLLLKSGARPWAGVVPCAALAGLVAVTGVLGLPGGAFGRSPGLLGAVALMTLIPVGEEVFFRGLLLAHFRRTLGTVAATLVVSLLFGFLHSLQGQFWVMFAGSLLLCATTLTTGSLLWALTLHVGWNTLCLVAPMSAGVPRLALASAAAGLTAVVIGWGLHGRQRVGSRSGEAR